MLINVLRSKIHRLTVTEANLNYIGSVTIDQALLKQVGLYANEKVQVVNINNGARIETYIIPGATASGVCCLNGAAARYFASGDKVIIMSYTWLQEAELQAYLPRIAFVNDNNQITAIHHQETAATNYQ